MSSAPKINYTYFPPSGQISTSLSLHAVLQALISIVRKTTLRPQGLHVSDWLLLLLKRSVIPLFEPSLLPRTAQRIA